MAELEARNTSRGANETKGIGSALAKAVMHHLGGQSENALNDLEVDVEGGSRAAEIFAARGYLQLELGRFDEAWQSYSKASEFQPGDPKVSFNTGVALQNLSRAQEAIPYFKHALSREPDWLEAKASIGVCMLQQKDYSEAIRIFNECIESDPSYQPALFGKAVSLQLMWRFDESKTIYDQILQVTPGSEPVHLNVISLGLQNKDYEMVRTYGERLLALHPDHPVALESLAAAAFVRNDMDQAQRLSEKLTLLAPKEFEYWFNLGLAYQRQGNFNEAIQAYVRARTIRPDLSYAHVQLGAVYLYIGDLTS